MGPIEELVVRAWGIGVRIDAGDRGRPGEQSRKLLAALDDARRLQHCGQFGRGCGVRQEGGTCVCTCQRCPQPLRPLAGETTERK